MQNRQAPKGPVCGGVNGFRLQAYRKRQHLRFPAVHTVLWPLECTDLGCSGCDAAEPPLEPHHWYAVRDIRSVGSRDALRADSDHGMQRLRRDRACAAPSDFLSTAKEHEYAAHGMWVMTEVSGRSHRSFE